MKKLLIILVILGVLGGGYAFIKSRSSQNTPTNIISVTRGDISEEVNITGKLVPKNHVDLSFERGGKITRVSVQAGDTVKQGQLLAVTSDDDIQAQSNQSAAGITVAQAQVKQAEAGVEIQRRRLSQTQQPVVTRALDISQSQTNLQDALQNARISAYEALQQVVNVTNGFFNDTPSLWYSIVDSQNAALQALQSLYLVSDITSATAQISGINNFFDTLNRALYANPTLDATKRSADITAVSGARDKLLQLSATLKQQDQAIQLKTQAAQQSDTQDSSTVSIQAATYDQAVESVAVAQGQLQSAQANYDSVQTQFGKTQIVAPFDGIAAKVSAKEGTFAQPGAPIISLASPDAFKIEAQVPEVDVGKVSVGNPVTIVFDALPNGTFAGKVLSIDPGETIVDGVVTFKITIGIDQFDPRLRSGMTANLTIETLRKSNVLLLPQYAILEKDSGTFVQLVARKDTPEISGEIPVTLGTRGQNGMAEVISGVSEGQTVASIGLK